LPNFLRAMKIKLVPAGFVIPTQPVPASKPPCVVLRRDGPAVRRYSPNANDWAVPQSLTESHCHVLEVLAVALHGRDINASRAPGFKLATIADLIRSKLATYGLKPYETHCVDANTAIALVQITDDGGCSQVSPRASADE
jgi:hypothetical protein